MSWQQMLLAKFPSFDPAWSTEVQAKWFDAFERLMNTQDAMATRDKDSAAGS